MCYTPRMAAEVGIRELRQNLSVYLARVKDGERFTVTERNRPVAELSPLPEGEDEYGRWLRRNNLSRPKGRWEDLPAPIDLGPGSPASRALQEQREDRLA